MSKGRPRFTDRSQVRSERISLVVTPVALAGIQTLAAVKKCSVNDFVASLIEGVVKKNVAVIENFNAAQRKAAAEINLDISVTADDNPPE